jgi:vesicle coat complex subunit
MPIIQYALPSKNKQLKKLLHFYWEVYPKYDDNGKLELEMILVVYVSNLSNYHDSVLIAHTVTQYETIL